MEASQRIDELIAGLDDWRGKTFAAVRACIVEAAPGIARNASIAAMRRLASSDRM